MNTKLLSTALVETFKRRGTHDLNLSIHQPPISWSVTFSSMAMECNLNPDINTGFKSLADFLKKI
jgi:hypothetical protein